MQNARCQCADPGCPACNGSCKRGQSVILYRVDMEDTSGTGFCEACAADAHESGLFDSERNFYSVR